MSDSLTTFLGLAPGPEQLGLLLSLIVAIWLGMTIEAFLQERRRRRRLEAFRRGERVS